MGVDSFSYITSVIGGTRITDAEIIHVGHLRRLEERELVASSVTDVGLAHVRGLTILAPRAHPTTGHSKYM